MTKLHSPATKKPLLIMAFLVLPFFGLTTLMITAGAGQVVPPPLAAKSHTVDVTTMTVQDAYVQSKVAYGRVEAAQQASAGFELGGTLLNVLVEEGDQVKQGQLLARLDTLRLDARMEELVAAHERAKSQARLARLSEKRVAELVKKKLESSQRLDEVREATVGADALVDEIQARMDSLKVELEKSELRAPFDAEILSRPVDKGSVVAAGQTVLTLQQNNGFLARIALAADDAFTLKSGESHNLVNDGNVIPAQILSIAKQRRLDTRTVDVLFSLNSPQALLLPGDLLSFTYDIAVEERGVWVPKTALNSGVRGLWTLFVVSDQGEQTVTAKSVELLYADDMKAYVRGPIKAGDMLVLNGGHRLVPNQQVVAKRVSHDAIAKVNSYE